MTCDLKSTNSRASLRTKRNIEKGRGDRSPKMDMSAVFEIIGTTGALIICASAIPQVVKTYRMKRSRDLSILYLAVLIFGMSLLQAYSVYVRDFVFIFANSLSMLSTGLLICLWFRYREQ